MATFVKRSSSQGLLLLALLLLAFSVIPAHINGQSTEQAKRGRRDIFNGCHYNQKVHDTDIFCCSKDNQCWSHLTECVKNCPCKVNCSPPASRPVVELSQSRHG